MNSRRASDVAVLIAATALTRFAFRSHYLYDIDSVNFALALRRFDPSVHQPHPPGYFLYVCLGRAASLIFENANTALVAVGIIFSCGTAAMIYVLADNWFGRSAARFAGLVFLFSPLAWFHGTVALTYIVESFFSALTGYLCWRIYSGSARRILRGGILAGMAVGMAAGFRPSSLLLLGPLLLGSLNKVGFRQAAVGLGALILSLLAWFVPMIRIIGAGAYFSSLVSLWFAVPAKTTLFNSSPLNSAARACTIAGIYFLCFGCAALLPLLRNRRQGILNRPKILFTRIWMAPGLLFFTFVYLKFVNSGYLLLLAPPLCVWMGSWASAWYASLRLCRALKMLAITSCAAVNTAIFIAAPVYCSWREVRRFESELSGIIRDMPPIASPRDTMIVGFDSHFLGYRHAGYYLPGYLTVQFPAVRLNSGMRVFAMENRNTRLERNLDTASVRNFVIFPLPPVDREYSDYMARVRQRFPPGDLRTIARSGREFVIGPVADLRFLFPSVDRPRQ